jgi:UDP-N-acetylmuramoyl-tripeptide--D-alanyl-D-alanine ligase
MRELGETSVSEHEEIGRTAVRLGVDRLVVVGDSDDAVAMADAARSEVAATGGATEVVRVEGVDQAAADIVATTTPTDVVLVKASRGVALERVAARLLEGVAP